MELEKCIRERRNDTRHPIIVQMKEMLLRDMTAEEKLLYPLIDQRMRQQMQDAWTEHAEVRKHL